MTVGDIHPHMRVVQSFDWLQKVVVHVYRRDLDGCPMAVCAWLDDFGRLQATDYPVSCLSRAGPDSGLDDDDIGQPTHRA